jgi:hypothetical protein
MGMTETFKCSLCGGEMTVRPDGDGGGFTVICLNPCDSLCHENVFGHGKTAKEAWEVSKEKFHASK